MLAISCTKGILSGGYRLAQEEAQARHTDHTGRCYLRALNASTAILCDLGTTGFGQASTFIILGREHLSAYDATSTPIDHMLQ